MAIAALIMYSIWFLLAFGVRTVVGLAAPVETLTGLDPLVDSPAIELAGLMLAGAGALLTLLAQLSIGDLWRARPMPPHGEMVIDDLTPEEGEAFLAAVLE